MSKKLEGRTAIVTGASRGLGLAICEAFEAEGATVVRATREWLNTEHQFPAAQVLISCAGKYGEIGYFSESSVSNWTDVIDTNLSLSAAVIWRAIPAMRAQGYGKIIQISGGGATAPMPGMAAYAASKAAVVRFAETIAEELRGTGIDVNSMSPGVLDTRLLDQVIAAGPEASNAEFHKRMVTAKARGGDDINKATALAVFLASAESDGITGKLISAQWDAWDDPDVQQLLRRNRDLFTLRRRVHE